MNLKNDLSTLNCIVEMMDSDDQARVASIKLAIEECVNRNSDCGPIALALVGLERSIEG